MPYKSRAQAAYFHIHKDELEKQGVNVSEWDSASRGRKLPARAATGGEIQSALNVVRRYGRAGGGRVGQYDRNVFFWQTGIEKDKSLDKDMVISSEPKPLTTFRKHIFHDPPSNHMDPNMPIDETKFPLPAPEEQGLADGGEVEDKPGFKLQHLPEGGDYYQAQGDQNDSGLIPAPSVDQGVVGDFSKYPAAVIGGIADYIGKPSQLMNDTSTAYPESGTWTEEDEQRRQWAMRQHQQEETNFAGDTMLNIAGISAPFVKPGTIGVAGGKLPSTKPGAIPYDLDPAAVAQFKRESGPLGSNPGGLYSAPDNQQWYIKTPRTVDQAKNEKLAAELYKLAGVPTADVRLTDLKGKPAIASAIIHGEELGKEGAIINNYPGTVEHFPADAWLANYDVVGLNKDNIIIDPQGNAHRIDLGGSLRYRAQGKPKTDFGPYVEEFEKMLNPQINPNAAEVFGPKLDINSGKATAQRIANIPNETIEALVDKYGPPSKTAKSDLAFKIMARRDHVAEVYGVKPDPWGDVNEPPPNAGPAGSTKEELESLIAQQKADEEEYWASIEKQAKHEYGLGQGVHAEDSAWQQRISNKFKSIDWQSYKPPQADLSPVKLPHATYEHVTKHGFNPNIYLMHGSKKVEFGGFNELKNPSEHKGFEPAFFASDNPEIAHEYTQGAGEEYVHGFIARPQKAAEIDWPSAVGYARYDPEAMHQIISAAKKKELDLVVIRNIEDAGADARQTQYAILNPAILRYPHAKFDPSKLHLRYPLAGLVGGGLFSYGTIKGQADEEKMNRGGTPKAKAGGGGIDHWVQHQAARNLHQEGIIRSPIPGRTDKIPMSVPTGAYILPSDVVSGLGQGNSHAGGLILSKMFGRGPLGMQPMQGRGGMNSGRRLPGIRLAAGGSSAPQTGGTVPIVAAGGEFVVHPDKVREIGNGDIGKGHKVLDQFVLHTRRQTIKTLKKLPGPKK